MEKEEEVLGAVAVTAAVAVAGADVDVVVVGCCEYGGGFCGFWVFCRFDDDDVILVIRVISSLGLSTYSRQDGIKMEAQTGQWVLVAAKAGWRVLVRRMPRAWGGWWCGAVSRSSGFKLLRACESLRERGDSPAIDDAGCLEGQRDQVGVPLAHPGCRQIPSTVKYLYFSSPGCATTLRLRRVPLDAVVVICHRAPRDVHDCEKRLCCRIPLLFVICQLSIETRL